MIYRSSDPFRDLIDREEELARFESMCPVCAICKERITDESFRRIGKDCYHDSCIDTVCLDSYIEEAD